MKKLPFLMALSVVTFVTANAQHSDEAQRIIEFPDVPGYMTLICDFHMHTVFSDGSVWPNIRVQEAIRDGLDAIALTDHIENQPHKDDIPHPDRNRAHNVAVESAGNSDLIIIKGSEITRSSPPGHANAIFITDPNRLILDDVVEVYREAKSQGGFIFWNHPCWTVFGKDPVACLSDMHLELINEGLLSGIEVVNGHTYSDEALQIALDYNLAIIGNSDIHGLIDWGNYEVPYGGHRPVTLVFATDRSEAGIKEALENRRTVVWFNNTLIGREEFLEPLVQSSLQVTRAWYWGDSSLLSITVENNSDVEYFLENKSDYFFRLSQDVLTLEPHDTTGIDIKTFGQLTSVSLTFEVLNAVIAPNTHLVTTFEFEIE